MFMKIHSSRARLLASPFGLASVFFHFPKHRSSIRASLSLPPPLRLAWTRLASSCILLVLVEPVFTLAILWVIQRFGQTGLGAVCLAERPSLKPGAA